MLLALNIAEHLPILNTRLILTHHQQRITLFDDVERDIVGEPFVEGSSELITEIQSSAGLAEDTLSVTFSDKPFLEVNRSYFGKVLEEMGLGTSITQKSWKWKTGFVLFCLYILRGLLRGCM